ncbi:GNAT family N-acetyltransferase [Polycladidibacter hongkongensis]|uniref:GNAT family N-acetyltransferase n=1 Tax=Polycladidibacter hongkongensis TaxID=1647556 RepID=UPI0008316940|nr:N-acetyltransferase [Pseudovibrio hongkongensis]
MNTRQAEPQETAAVAQLFTATFTASEGASEGKQIGDLAHRLMSTPDEPAICFGTWQDQQLTAAVIFTELRVAHPLQVMLLSPLAVAPNWQRQGNGQALVKHSMDILQEQGVSHLVTYGDPAFYSKLGFTPIREHQLKAPQPLSYPRGWIARPLSEHGFDELKGTASCASALDDPQYW